MTRFDLRTVALLTAVLAPARPLAAQQPGRIAFVRHHADQDSGVTTQLYVMNEDGSRVRRLLDRSLFTGQPAFSQGGQRIALWVERQLSYTELFVMNSDGSGLSRLTNDGRSASSPAWSPDGRRLAFASDRDGDNEIYVMSAGDTAPTRLTRNAADDHSPAWSPDDRRIAFVSERDGSAGIYVMNADGSAVRRLSANAAQDGAPAWSPDGGRIAFHGERSGNLDIYVMNADGSEVIRLTDHPARDEEPAWSPDGRRIAFASERDGSSQIYHINADGSGLTRLTNSPSEDRSPTWGVGPAPLTAATARPVAPAPPPAPGAIVLPPLYDSSRTWPVVVLLPATFGTARSLMEEMYPAGEATERGFAIILAAGEGSPDDYLTGEAWWNTILRYERQVLNDLATFTSRYRLDTSRVVLAGFSMGGDLAWALALRNPARLIGALVMGSRASYRARPADHRLLVTRGVRFYLAMGDADEVERRNGAREAARFLERLGVTHRHREIPGLGHSAAPPAMFAEALAFLLTPN